MEFTLVLRIRQRVVCDKEDNGTITESWLSGAVRGCMVDHTRTRTS